MFTIIGQAHIQVVMDTKVVELIEDVKENSPTISLLVTEQCNFSCEHCFYNCSPQSPNLFMSQEILDDIEGQIQILTDLDIHISINLVGDEPTINLKRFEGYLDWAMRMSRHYSASVQMTTNGWWLKDLKFLRKFMKIVGRTVWPEEFGLSNGFTCRISNDVWLDEFRPAWLVGEPYGSGGGYFGNGKRPSKLGGVVDSLWEPWSENYEEPVFESINGYQCLDCYDYWDELPEEGECPSCGENDIETMYSEVNWTVPPAPDGDEAWLYVDMYTKNGSNIIPTGRGANIGSNDVGSSYCAGYSLSYKPDGTLYDICCRGSNVPMGTTKDNPLLLFALSKEYIKDEGPSCWSCHETAQLWIDDGLEEHKEIWQTKIDMFEGE